MKHYLIQGFDNLFITKYLPPACTRLMQDGKPTKDNGPWLLPLDELLGCSGLWGSSRLLGVVKGGGAGASVVRGAGSPRVTS